MKTFVFIIYAFFSPIISFSQIIPENRFTINISANSLGTNARIYLLYWEEGRRMLDSADKKNGYFIFNGKIDRVMNASLITDPDRIGFEGLTKKSVTALDILKLYIYPGTIVLKTDNLIVNSEFVNSAINEGFLKLDRTMKPIKDERQAIRDELNTTIDTNRISTLKKRYDSLSAVRKPLLKTFVETNPNSFAALMALQQYAGSFPDVSIIEPMFMQLSQSVRDMPDGKEFYKFLMDSKFLTVGAKAPEFVQNDTSGNTISLASYRGKYVLIDFWASWCGPCRATFPGLKEIYKKFKNKNFAILGISLDGANGKKAWLNAIKQDGLDWDHVSDLKQWNNQVAKLYSIRLIPQSFLIDPEGVIIARNLNNEQLAEKLNEVLSKE